PGAPVAAAEKGRPAGAAGDRAGVGQRPATGEVYAVPTRARRAGIAVGAAAATAAATAALDRHARGVRVADPGPVHDGAVAAGATTTARTNVAGCIAPATAVPAGDHDRLRGVRRDDRAVRASTATARARVRPGGAAAVAAVRPRTRPARATRAADRPDGAVARAARAAPRASTAAAAPTHPSGGPAIAALRVQRGRACGPPYAATAVVPARSPVGERRACVDRKQRGHDDRGRQALELVHGPPGGTNTQEQAGATVTSDGRHASRPGPAVGSENLSTPWISPPGG